MLRTAATVLVALMLICLGACSPSTVSVPPPQAQATVPVLPPPTVVTPGVPPPALPPGIPPEGVPMPLTPGVSQMPAPPPNVTAPSLSAVSGGVRVGLLLPLSGRDAGLGRAMLDAAQLAVFDFGDDQFTLLPFDTEESGAALAAQQALDRGAQLILGPLFARQVAEVAAAAAPRGVAVVTFSNDVSVAGPSVLVMGLPPSQAVRRVVDYARTQGVDRFAALLPDDVNGGRIADVVRDAVSASGGTIVRLDRYAASTTDFTPAVRTVAEFEARRARTVAVEEDGGRNTDAKRRAAKLATTRDVDYQALVIAESGQRLRNMAALIPYYDIDTPRIRLLGPSSWEDPALGREPSLVGAWFAAPDPAGRKPFEDRFRAAFGRGAPRLAALSYDASGLAAILARLDGRTDFSVQALRNPSGFSGIEGLFRFGDDGVIERGLSVMEIGLRGVSTIAPAPTTFQPPTQ